MARYVCIYDMPIKDKAKIKNPDEKVKQKQIQI